MISVDRKNLKQKLNGTCRWTQNMKEGKSGNIPNSIKINWNWLIDNDIVPHYILLAY